MANSSTAKPGLIDIHMHAQPTEYLDAIKAVGVPSGFSTSSWSIEEVISYMDSFNIERAILSISSPGVSVTGNPETAKQLARKLNTEMAGYASDPKHNNRIGFFGTLPDWTDVEATLQEIDFLFGEQKLAHGINCFTLYQKRLLGDPMFKPIWEKLNYYKALVFVHPAKIDIEPRFIAGILPQPLVEFPMATTRAAVDLVMTGTLKNCPDVDIVLVHAGGTIPFLLHRILSLFGGAKFLTDIPVTTEEATEGFQRFYYDLALSTSVAQLDGLTSTIDPSHILFGSDHPYCPPPVVEKDYNAYLDYVETQPRGKMIAPEVLRANAQSLLAAHEPKRG